MITAKQAAALRVVRDRPGVFPREFARALWPDAPGWRVSVKCGPNGSHRGGQMYQAGGAYLGRLARVGLVSRTPSGFQSGAWLTRKGEDALAEFDRANPPAR